MDNTNARANIKRLRRFIGATVEEFANAVDYSPAYISRIESGDRPVTDAFLFAVSQRFVVSIDRLCRGKLK